jgi:DNA-binding MarR family transcriptional regulator
VSRPTRRELTTWRAFLEASTVVIDVLDQEMDAERGLPLRWYDVLIRLEEGDGVRMNELADRILFSKSGLTRMVDRMEQEGLVRRERPPEDRRVIRVFLTDEGRERMRSAREVHHQGIQRHFLSHLDGEDLDALAAALSKLQDHLQELRPGRIVART